MAKDIRHSGSDCQNCGLFNELFLKCAPVNCPGSDYGKPCNIWTPKSDNTEPDTEEACVNCQKQDNGCHPSPHGHICAGFARKTKTDAAFLTESFITTSDSTEPYTAKAGEGQSFQVQTCGNCGDYARCYPPQCVDTCRLWKAKKTPFQNHCCICSGDVSKCDYQKIKEELRVLNNKRRKEIDEEWDKPPPPPRIRKGGYLKNLDKKEGIG